VNSVAISPVPTRSEFHYCCSDDTGFVREGAFGVDWADACRAHDECYAAPDADLCDYNLQENMSLACEAQDGGLLSPHHGRHLLQGRASPRQRGVRERAGGGVEMTDQSFVR
jgi:hypothetical protein